jgi:hypothetical protein
VPLPEVTAAPQLESGKGLLNVSVIKGAGTLMLPPQAGTIRMKSARSGSFAFGIRVSF